MSRRVRDVSERPLAVPPGRFCRQQATEPPVFRKMNCRSIFPVEGEMQKSALTCVGSSLMERLRRVVGSHCGNGRDVRWRWKEACQVAV